MTGLLGASLLIRSWFQRATRPLPCDHIQSSSQLNGFWISNSSGRATARHRIHLNLQEYDKFTETSLALHNFQVTAECAWGYEGTPVVSACSGPNQPYSMEPWLEMC